MSLLDDFGFDTPDLSEIDLDQPIAEHELNKGKTFWLKGLPGRYGGLRAWDLVQQTLCTFNGFTAGFGWTPISYPGGFGSISVTGSGASGAYVSASPSPLSGATSATFGLWIYQATGVTGNNVDGGWVVGNTIYSGSFFLGTGTGISKAVDVYIGNTLLSSTASSASFNGAWHHVVIVYVGSTSISLYIDGKLDSSTTTSIPASIPAHTGIQLGGSSSTSGGGPYWSISHFDDVFFVPGIAWSAQLISMSYYLSQQVYPGVLRRRSRLVRGLPAAAGLPWGWDECETVARRQQVTENRQVIPY